MDEKKEPAEIVCEKIRNGELKSIINPDGTLTAEAQAFVDKRFAESEIAFEPLVEKLRQSRRITAEDLAFRISI